MVEKATVYPRFEALAALHQAASADGKPLAALAADIAAQAARTGLACAALSLLHFYTILSRLVGQWQAAGWPNVHAHGKRSAQLICLQQVVATLQGTCRPCASSQH